jgi:phage terminase small subunit
MSKLTQKQERFAQVVVETGNYNEAYRQSYGQFNNMNNNSSKRQAIILSKIPVISQEIDRLRGEARERHSVSVDTVTLELEDARIIAMESSNASAAVQASMGKAKLHGLLVDKQQIQGAEGVRFEMVIDGTREDDKVRSEPDA